MRNFSELDYLYEFFFESDYLCEFFLSSLTNLKIKIYRTNFSVVLYGCETWSLTLRE